jgi:O-antigen/teichoic acid export membrane protein
MSRQIRFINLRHRTVTGVSWSAVSQLITQCFSWVISIILARILGPKAYGLIGMTAVFSGFAMLFSDLGLGAAVVQRKKLEQRHLDTAFWINVLAGFVMTGLMAACAPLIASFFNEPRLKWLSIIIALQFFLSGLSVVQQALIRREMRFRALAGVQIASTVAAGVTGLIMAFSGMGVWSLVAQMLCGSLIRVLLFWQVAHWHPSWSFEMKAGKELFGFSAYVLGFNIVNYWGRNADNLLVGRFVGAQALGIYSRAYTLMLLPLTQITYIVAGVMIPALSSIQEDTTRVKRSYLKAISIVGLVTFPLMIGFFVTADHVVLALLGKKWAEVIPIFKILCGVGLLQSITATMGWIYQSQGRTALQFRMGLVMSSGCVVAFIIGIHWGVLGVAWAYCLFSLIAWYPIWTTCGNIIGLSFGEMVKTLLPSFACAAGMGCLVWGIGHLLPSSTPNSLCLSLQITSGVFIYVLLVASFKLEAAREAGIAVKEMLGGAFTMVSDPLRRRTFLRPWARVR